MKKGLLAILVFGAALCFGGYAQAEEQHFMVDGAEIIAQIQARAAIIEAQGYLNQCRSVTGPFWSEDENLPRMPVPAPLPVASSPQPRATVAPVASSPVLPPPPIVKPPVVAAPVEKPKVEQAKIQVPPAKPAGTVQGGLKVSALKIPTDRGEVTVKGIVNGMIKSVKYNKGDKAWALIYETKDGKIVDKDGEPTSFPELVNAPPRGAILVPLETPQI